MQFFFKFHDFFCLYWVTYRMNVTPSNEVFADEKTAPGADEKTAQAK